MNNFKTVTNPLNMGVGMPHPMPPVGVPGMPVPQIGAPMMPMQPTDAMVNPHDAYRASVQDWRGLRPDHQDFTGTPQDWRTQIMDWRGQRPDRPDMHGGGGGVPPQPVPSVPGMMQAITKTFNQGYAANNPYAPVKPFYPMGG